MNAAALVSILVVLAVIVIALLIAGLLIIWSTKLYNAIAKEDRSFKSGTRSSRHDRYYSSRQRVPEPGISRAMGIVIMTSIFAMFVQFFYVYGVSAAFGDAREFSPAVSTVVRLLSLAINYSILTLVLTNMLPAPLDRAALVALCYLAISFLIAVPLIFMAYFMDVVQNITFLN